MRPPMRTMVVEFAGRACFLSVRVCNLKFHQYNTPSKKRQSLCTYTEHAPRIVAVVLETMKTRMTAAIVAQRIPYRVWI